MSSEIRSENLADIPPEIFTLLLSVIWTGIPPEIHLEIALNVLPDIPRNISGTSSNLTR